MGKEKKKSKKGKQNWRKNIEVPESEEGTIPQTELFPNQLKNLKDEELFVINKSNEFILMNKSILRQQRYKKNKREIGKRQI